MISDYLLFFNFIGSNGPFIIIFNKGLAYIRYSFFYFSTNVGYSLRFSI